MDEEQVDSSTWKKISLLCPRADGSQTEVTFLRSPEWIRESIRLASGKKFEAVDQSLAGHAIEIVIPEIALSGMAMITAVEDCPLIPEGPGEVVTGTFRTNQAKVLDLRFSTISDQIGVTTTHPIWSETRQEFVEAGKLEIGEEVLTLNGQCTRLSDITPRAGPETVYNFEVANQHVYYVSRDGLLVHNANYLTKWLSAMKSKAVSTLKDMHHSIPRAIQKRLRQAGNVNATHPDIVGRPGLPNRIPVARLLHKLIHGGKGYKAKGGIGGGHYNNAFHRLIERNGGYKNVTLGEVLKIRDFLVRWFGLK